MHYLTLILDWVFKSSWWKVADHTVCLSILRTVSFSAYTFSALDSASEGGSSVSYDLLRLFFLGQQISKTL